ncbi:ABC transporter ATP-binding protein [Sinirhodobacter populi]|uniref:ABC transporter ATP-binding protein n=1 Tax=Paenirhodobacter populi TaxID=2306993 RepID=A0A443K6C8_9RHOB|nr:ABC transporter ATP-binding protein [Sinirhodobacter populi]RWR28290.1 ABC transporter ATP-binding protein [Sinirhodobacter populi]
MTAEVRFDAVQHRFGSFTALHQVDLTISAGEFIVLLGPSGCGKTTLLSILGGFLTPSAGRVLIGGRDMTHVAPKDRPTTTMFQDYALFPHMSLRDNVGFGLRMRGIGRTARKARAEEMLDMVGLADKAGRRPHELSGGQRQRVALARALAVSPDVLLLDEPLGALDLKLRRQMQEELKAIQRRVGTTFVHVTHDQEEAMAVADRIVVMNQGRIEHCGTPQEVYLRPATLFSANFMGEVNRIPVASGGATPLGPMPFGQGTLCLRPESIGLAGDLPLGPARLEEAAFFGAYLRCQFRPVAAPGMRLVAHLPQGLHLKVGDEVALFARDPVILPTEPGAEP